MGKIMVDLQEILTREDIVALYSNTASLKKLNEDFLNELKTNFDSGIM
jgi:hypothetical protein